MKSRDSKNLKIQSIAATSALIASAVLLAAVLIVSEAALTKLESRTMPLIEEALAAARDEPGRAGELMRSVDGTLRRAEPLLMLIASHRDLMEMLRCSAEAVRLGAIGDSSGCMEAISVARTYLRLILESNDLTIGNIL
ncbi:MAG: hypothetical protein IK064_02310 [Clostridia bacterium]|nr:hypothetical protein [Clostridia bacterium]